MFLKQPAAAVVAALLCLSASVASADTTEGQTATPPAIWPGEAWEVSTPEEQGLDSGTLARLVDTVGGFRQDSLLVIRHGRIVADAYYAPYEAGISHDLRSVTKSVTGTLIAIGLQAGLLDTVDHPILDLFPEKPISNIDDSKKAITVQNLLDMTSGIAWREKAYTPDETVIKMYEAADRVEFVLSQPMKTEPGTAFDYNSGNPYVLSGLITKATGGSALKYARRELFAPLGIVSEQWGRVDAQGITDGEAGLHLAPHDMARIGYLYLRDGIWNGRQIIPSSWVERAREGRVAATYGFHYANLWWSLPEKGAYMALGRHSQIILVIPKLDIVAVMTGILRDDEYYPTARLVEDIASAVKSDGPLPADSVGQSLLAASIGRAATERPSPLGDTPELAKTISGKTYRLGDNPLHVKTFSLRLDDPRPSWEFTTENAEHLTRRFAGLIGLDGVTRKSQASYGIDAIKGRWINGHSFVVERRILGHSETQFWTLTFDGTKVEIAFENTDGYTTTAQGEEAD
jgi:CubicO group peptidase (beta-lactamase class C family)